MGGRPQGFFSRVVAISSTVAASACSHWPSKRFIFHTSAFFLASYFALPAMPVMLCQDGSLPWLLILKSQSSNTPWLVWISALAVLSGTGTVTTTLRAKSFSLKALFTLTFTSSRVRPSSLITGSTLNGNDMPSWHLCRAHLLGNL